MDSAEYMKNAGKWLQGIFSIYKPPDNVKKEQELLL